MSPPIKRTCYVCQVDDGNAVDFNPAVHHVCLICAAKLTRLGWAGVGFDFGDATVYVTAEPRDTTRRTPHP